MLSLLKKEQSKYYTLRKFHEQIARDKKYWKRIASSYDEALIDKSTAEESSLAYEKFEDIYLDLTLQEYVSKGPVIFIEIGSGTGRYIVRYGCKVSETADHTEVPYDSMFDKNLKLIIGVDFSLEMLKECYKNLKEKKLMQEYLRRIFLINDYGETFSLAFDRVEEYQRSQKVVCCMFNTLGNIDPEERRILVLKRLHDLIYPRGIGVISVFNKDELSEIGFSYYLHEKVKKLILPPKPKKLIFDTEKGYVYTDDFVGHWFSFDEMKKLFSIAGLKIMDQVIGNDPETLPDPSLLELARRGMIFKVKAIG